MSTEPLPCLSCGAPMRVLEAAHLHATPELVCDFCSRREPLPAEAAERHRYVRLRLEQLARARAQLEAPLTTYRTLKTSVLPGIGFMCVVAGIQTFTAVSHAAGRIELSTLLPVAVMVGAITGWFGMMFTFRNLVAPFLQARPALSAGMPATCRSCGGDLPQVRAAQVSCPYCRADNLLGTAASAQVGSMLQADAQNAFNASRAKLDPSAFHKPARSFYTWGAAGAVLALVAIQGVLFAIGPMPSAGPGLPQPPSGAKGPQKVNFEQRSLAH